MNEFEKLDALHLRDMGIGVDYPEKPRGEQESNCGGEKMEKEYIYNSDEEMMQEETIKPTDIKDYSPKESKVPVDEPKYSKYINEGE